MTRNKAGYLRLHVEETAPPKRPQLDEIRNLPLVCDAFQHATGWRLRLCPPNADTADYAWSQELVDQDGGTLGLLALASSGDSAADDGKRRRQPAVDFETACKLAAAVGELLRELYRTRHVLWQREAELAAGVPVAAHSDEELNLAARLENVLKAGAQAVDCQAASAYMLDESTKQLKLRSCWGLPRNRFLEPPRPLRGAVADLEALVGHAVVLQDTSFLKHWKVPEEFRSAVCVPISSPTLPFGTLWMFCDRVREFTTHETNLVEIVAGRLAADLEREMLLQHTLSSKKLVRQLGEAAQWQHNRLPRIKPLVKGWQVAGFTTQRDPLGGDFHDWFVLPDSCLAIAVGDAEGRLLEAGFACTTVQTALKSHAGYRHTSQQMLERVNETLWTASTGGQFASLFYARIQPDTGDLEHSIAGHVGAVVLEQTQRRLTPADGDALGTQPDNLYPATHDHLAPGDILVVVSEGVQKILKGERQEAFWSQMESHRRQSADELIVTAEGLLGEFHDRHASDDQTVLIVKRESR